MKKIRVGSGAGYGGDRIEPAVDLIRFGNLDYIIFECLAERTVALAQQKKMKDNSIGYNELLEYRMSKVLPLLKEDKVKIITNMGAANVRGAMEKVARIAGKCGLEDLKIFGVVGDDLSECLERYMSEPILETGEPLSSIAVNIISANAYLGAEGIVKALRQGADVVITGRVADPALTLGPVIYEFDWSMEDYEKLGKGTVMGHILECGAQACGGYFADPPYKEVPELWNVGFPIGEITEDGEFSISKLSGAGGCVTRETISEQLLYEIHDPKQYFTPDVVADFSGIELEEKDDAVRVIGASGRKKNDKYKVSVAYKDGYIGEGEISYAGSGAKIRAKLALEVIQKRLGLWREKLEEERYDIIGINAICRNIVGNDFKSSTDVLGECMIRVAVRTKDHQAAEMVGKEVETLYTNGPAGGGGARQNVKEVIAIASIFVPQEDLKVETIEWEEKMS